MNNYRSYARNNSTVLSGYLMTFMLGFFMCFVIINTNINVKNIISKIDIPNFSFSTRKSVVTSIETPIETETTAQSITANSSVDLNEVVEDMEETKPIFTTTVAETTPAETTVPETSTIAETEKVETTATTTKPKVETTKSASNNAVVTTTVVETTTSSETTGTDTTTHTITNLGYHCSAKTYSSWKAVTATGSEQYNLLHNTQVHVCDDGMLRDDDGYICAALGTYFGKIGSRWVFVTEDGKEIKIIKCDAKADCETDSAHICGVANYDIIEFYIETSKFTKESNGYVHWGNFNHVEEYSGAIVGWYQVDSWYDSAY